MTEFPPSPPRLSTGEAGADLLRRANHQFGAGIDEPAAFDRLRLRLAQQRQHRMLGLGVAAAVACATVIVFSGRPPVELELTAESLPKVTRVAPAAPPPSTPGEPVALPPNTQPALEPPTSNPPARRLEPKPATSAPLVKAAPSTAPAAPPVAEATPKDASECLKLAREGDRAGAEQCFQARASGGGLTAELALYELSRLRRDVLDDPSGALRALDEHRKRFPNGGLRAEVELTRVELLVRTGRPTEALSEIDRMLASESVRERSAELVRIRDRLRATQSERESKER